MEFKDIKKMGWEVLEVYKGWFDLVYRKLRPYRVYLTSANISMFLVTVIAIIIGFLIFFRKRKAKEQWEKARRASLAAKQDEEWLKARKRARLAKKAKEAEEIKDPYMAKIHKSIIEEQKKQRELSGSDDDDVLISAEDITNIREKGADDRLTKPEPRFAEDGRDALEYAMHIPAELKKIQNKVTVREMEKQLSEDQKQEEARTRRRQLEQIFQLMQEQKDKFGPQTTEDMEEQMRMYSL